MPNEDPSLYVLKLGLKPLIDKNFPANERKLIRDIMEYRDRNIEILGTPYLYTYPVFPEKNKNSLYEYCGVTEEQIDELRKQVKTPDSYSKHGKDLYKDKQNFTSTGCLMVLIMNYYYEHGKMKELELMFRYLGYYFYFSTYLHQFGRYPVNRAVMDYTINSLEKSFIIKRTGSLDDMILHGIKGAYDANPKQIAECSDEQIWKFLDAAKNRINGYLRKIRNRYYENHQKGNSIFTNIDKQDDNGEDIISDSSIRTAKVLADAATVGFFSNPVSAGTIDLVSKIDKVNPSEIRTAVNKIKQDNNVDDVSSFYNACFYLYISSQDSSSMSLNMKTVGNTAFIREMDKLYKKGNSKDANVLEIKRLCDKWLRDTSKTYRASNREGTINNLRRSIYHYFMYALKSYLN